MTTWASKYLCIPYVRGGASLAGADCFGLVQMIYRDRFGVVLGGDEESVLRYKAATRRVSRGEEVESWSRSEAPGQPYDIVLMSELYVSSGEMKSDNFHCGVVVSPGVLIHTTEKRGVQCGRFVATDAGAAHPELAHRVSGLYRYVVPK